MSESAFSGFPRALGGPFGTAVFKSTPLDFIVDEQMDIPEHPTGAHWWLRMAKQRMNTKDVARVLADIGEVRIREVGYAGMKDRQAVATQWLSIPIAALDPEKLPDQLPEGLELLEWRRARKTIRRGGLKGNRFRIRLRAVDGDRPELERAMQRASNGLPNYFGAQRFGRDGQNLVRARKLFAGSLERLPRHERGIYLSAARSWLFNRVLATRIENGSWNQLLPGEAVILDGSRSWFALDDEPTQLDDRLNSGDIHPSGPLPGDGDPGCTGECLALETAVLELDSDLVDGLKSYRMKPERRALRVYPSEWQHEWKEDDLEISFTLQRGCYATAVLREFLDLKEAS